MLRWLLLLVTFCGSNAAVRAADSDINLVVTNDAPGVRVEGAFERVDAYLSRSPQVLKSAGGGPHRAIFLADPGRRGYYRVFAWWPQGEATAGAATLIVHHLGGNSAARPVDQRVGGGQWTPIGTFALPATAAQVEFVAVPGATLLVDAIRLQFVGTEPPALTLESGALPLAVVGETYQAVLTTTAGTPPIQFTVDPGRLPPGIVFDAATGTLSGVPSTAGRYSFDVEAFDHSGQRAQRAYTLQVVDAPRAPAPSSGMADKTALLASARDGTAVGTPPDLSNLVALIAALPEGEWLKANVNLFSDVWAPAELRPLDKASNPPPSKIILAWSSFAWNPNGGELLLYGGGHANYSGNDVYRWRGATRRWERASLPSEIKQDDLGNYLAVDGWDHAPASAHTYDTNTYFPHIDRFVAFGGAAYNSGGPFTRQISPTTARRTGPFFFDPSRADPNKVGGSTGSHVQRVAPHPEVVGGNMWANRDIYDGRIANTESMGGFVNGCTAYADENGHDVAYIGARTGGGTGLNLFKYTVPDLAAPAADSVQMVGMFWSGTDTSTACGFDPVRKLLVRTGDNGFPFTYWNLNTPGAANPDVRVIPADPSGEFAATLASNSIAMTTCGLDFDPRRARFALWCGDGRVWTLTPPASPSPTGWTIQKQRAPALATPVNAPGTGVLGKWKYISNLDAFMGLEDMNQGNIWIYKPVGWVPPGGNATAPTTTTTALVTAPNPSTTGQAVALTATVTGNAPTGTVNFLDNGNPIAACASIGLTGTGNSRSATCSADALTTGTHTLGAAYSGDLKNTASVSPGKSQVVNAPVNGVNVALAANGGVATASSLHSPGFSPDGVNDNRRSGAGWGSGGGWNDGTPRVFGDWVQINFNGSKTIDHIVVFTLQDNYPNPVEPTDAMTFTLYGLTDFDVQAWNGTTWATLGSVSGNNRIKRVVSFAPFTTDRIRIFVKGSRDGLWSRITEVEAWAPSNPVTPVNFALASKGANAAASSTHGTGYAPGFVVDNKRSGSVWGSGGGWNDGTGAQFPDWVQITFDAPRTIDRAIVYSVQDNYLNPAEPTDSMTFSRFGITDFQVQGWDGSNWTTLGNVTGNTLVKRAVSFDPYTTDRIRINVTKARDGLWSRITEVEAWSPTTPVAGTNYALASNGGSASASSTIGAGYAVAGIIDGKRSGRGWGNGAGWNDGTTAIFSDWAQVNFNGIKTLDHVVVFSLQDDFHNPVEPTDSLTFRSYGLTGFQVQGWTGAAWVTLATVAGNRYVKRTVSFTPFATDRVRLLINSTADGAWSRVTEFEAWGR